MDSKVKKLWVDALRSGKYRQAHGAIRTPNNGFCCLGVLCNLHAVAHPNVAESQINPEVYLGEDAFAPTEVVEWAGLASCDGGNVVINGVTESLVIHNDSGRRFATIADAIEEQL